MPGLAKLAFFPDKSASSAWYNRLFSSPCLVARALYQSNMAIHLVIGNFLTLIYTSYAVARQAGDLEATGPRAPDFGVAHSKGAFDTGRWRGLYFQHHTVHNRQSLNPSWRSR